MSRTRRGGRQRVQIAAMNRSLAPVLSAGRNGGAALVLAVAVAAGCEEKPRPWSRDDGAPAVLQPVPGAGIAGAGASLSGAGGGATGAARESAGAPQGSSGETTSGAPSAAAGEASGAPAAGSASVEIPSEDPVPGSGDKVTPGGGWVRCREGFALSGDPVKDVTRLGLLCGPSNGMRRRSRQAIVGVVGEHEPPVTASIRAARGACYRVLAAADAGVGELDVTVRSSRGAGVAADHAKGRLAVVQPDRPFCTFSDETFTVEVSAARGAGRFAAEVWALGEARKRGDPGESPADEAPLDEPD